MTPNPNYVMVWISVSDKLPKLYETVWITDGKGWVDLGCRVNTEENVWLWAKSNGIIYSKNDEIISECELDDLNM